MMDLDTLPRFDTPRGVVYVATGEEVARHPAWAEAFAHCRKDARYYEVVEQTIRQGFAYRYFVIEDAAGRARAVQPFFLLDQDLIQGAGSVVQSVVDRLRRLFPKALTLRTLMVGCAAGEGHLCHPANAAGNEGEDDRAAWISDCLHDAVKRYARRVKARLVVLKEFHADYRRPLGTFSNNGYARVPSLPMTRLNIDYPTFDDYMARALSKVTRKGLRRKFRDAEAGGPIELEVVDDITPYVEEVYPLYLSVYDRSPLHFEKLTKEYLCQLGRRMPDKARFFVWRRSGKAVAFSLCLVDGDTIYDEYLGLDYSVALDLHLYFYTFRDIVAWAMARGYKSYVSSALNYDPKLHFKCELVPLDLYVSHTSPVLNAVLKRVVPWLEPTRADKTLRLFPNYADLWGRE